MNVSCSYLGSRACATVRCVARMVRTMRKGGTSREGTHRLMQLQFLTPVTVEAHLATWAVACTYRSRCGGEAMVRILLTNKALGEDPLFRELLTTLSTGKHNPHPLPQLNEPRALVETLPRLAKRAPLEALPVRRALVRFSVRNTEVETHSCQSGDRKSLGTP